MNCPPVPPGDKPFAVQEKFESFDRNINWNIYVEKQILFIVAADNL